jgi:hypothetical protein
LRRAWAEAKAPKTGPGFEDFFASVVNRVKADVPADLRTFKNTNQRKKTEAWIRFHWKTRDVHVGLWAQRTPTGTDISVYFSNWACDAEVADLLMSNAGPPFRSWRIGISANFRASSEAIGLKRNAEKAQQLAL